MGRDGVGAVEHFSGFCKEGCMLGVEGYEGLVGGEVVA